MLVFSLKKRLYKRGGHGFQKAGPTAPHPMAPTKESHELLLPERHGAYAYAVTARSCQSQPMARAHVSLAGIAAGHVAAGRRPAR
jgi:hypothetical protein